MKSLNIESGKRFGRLSVIKEVPDGSRYRKFMVECDCGVIKIVYLASMTTGITKSCGCLQIENRKKVNLKHGHNTRDKGMTKTYSTWAGMIKRCCNKSDKNYKDYGGRGILVCERWLKFENFLADMGERPEGLSIDRINNNDGYYKNNCRWATVSQQNLNRRKWTCKKKNI